MFMIKKFSKLALLLVIGLSIISCKNFMTGADALAEVDYQVWLANQVRPEAKIISPVVSADGDYRNSSIIISFTKPINTTTFENGFDVLDSEGKSVRSCYISETNKPTWSNDKKQVILKADETNLLIIPESGSETITITLSLNIKDTENVPISKPVSESFKIKVLTDKEKPEFITIEAAIDTPDIATPLPEGTKNFIEGALGEKTDEIFTKNHIKNKFNLYIKGHDYGTFSVYSTIKYKRIYNAEGKAVSEDENSIVELLDTKVDTINSAKNFLIDLSGENYMDGLYKFDVSLSDASNNICDTTKTFYVIRDTKFSVAQRPFIQNSISDGRDKEGLIPTTLSAIKSGTNDFTFGMMDGDLYFTYNGKSYKSAITQLDLYYGSSFADKDLSKLSKKIEPWIWENASGFVLTYDDEILKYINDNPNKDLFLKGKFYDCVGNSSVIEAVVPHQRKFWDYTIDANNVVTLNCENKNSSDITHELQINDFTIEERTHIYYGKKVAGTADNDIKLYRNYLFDFKYANEPLVSDAQYSWVDNNKVYNTYTTYQEKWDSDFPDKYDSFSDKYTFTKDNPNDEYIVVIQTAYYYKNITGDGAGYTVCQPKIVNVKNNTAATSSDFANTLNTLTPQVTKTIQGKNTGTTKLTIDKTQFNEAGVEYIYCWSPDNGTTWNYYPSNEFIINTNVVPPVYEWADYNNPDFMTDEKVKSYTNLDDNKTFKLPTMDTEYQYITNGKVKVLAKKNNIVKESQTVTVSFSYNEDNLAPSLNGWTKAHNLTMSADGTLFSTYNNVLVDAEFNDDPNITYYYTDYLSVWENNLNVLTENEILTLPKGNQTALINTDIQSWNNDHMRDEQDNRYIAHELFIQIPVNGLEDGDYMFFVTAKDLFGNSTTKPLAKTHIGTFKNQLNVSYKDGKITAELPVEANENFEENHILVEYYDSDDTNIADDKWVKFTADRHMTTYSGFNDKHINYHCVNKMNKAVNKLTFSTENAVSVSGSQNFKNVTIPGGHFYKFVATSYNIDKNAGLRVVDTWSDNVDQVTWLDGGDHQFDAPTPDGQEHYEVYDAYTDETASYPTFMYIPAEANTNNFFESSTATMYSDKPVFISVISSLRDLGDSIAEWERRGKTVYTHVHEPNATDKKIDFNYQDAIQMMRNSTEEGKRYFVVIAHFQDNKSAISKVFAADLF